MTKLELFQSAIIWICLGIFICYKRKWYKDDVVSGDVSFYCIMATIFMPINLFIILIKIFFINEWKNN